MHIWVWKRHVRWFATLEEFVEVECRMSTFQHVLVALGARPNPSSAQKAIERGEVWWRKDYEGDWLKVKKHNEQLLEGRPLEIRWTKPYSQGYAEVMVPLPMSYYAKLGRVLQGRRYWSSLMREPFRPSRWAHYRDLVENLWRIIQENT